MVSKVLRGVWDRKVIRAGRAGKVVKAGRVCKAGREISATKG